MLWLIICIVVALMYSITAFFDNYIADEVYHNKTPQSAKIIYGFTYLVAAAVTGIVFGLENIEIWKIAILLVAGAISSFASIMYYRGLKYEEATGATIFLQLQPVIYLVADFILFGQVISLRQALGFIVLMAAPLVVIFSRHRAKARGSEIKAAIFFVAYIALTSASGLISTHVGEGMAFPTMFFWVMSGRCIFDLVSFAITPKWQRRFKNVFKRNPKALLASTVVDQTIYIIGEFGYRYALIIGTAALTSVTVNSLELIFTFVLGIVLSTILPRFGREKLSRHIIIAHLFAILLSVAGIIILQ